MKYKPYIPEIKWLFKINSKVSLFEYNRYYMKYVYLHSDITQINKYSDFVLFGKCFHEFTEIYPHIYDNDILAHKTPNYEIYKFVMKNLLDEKNKK